MITMTSSSAMTAFVAPAAPIDLVRIVQQLQLRLLYRVGRDGSERLCSISCHLKPIVHMRRASISASVRRFNVVTISRLASTRLSYYYWASRLVQCDLV